jgi:hypothetical protein
MALGGTGGDVDDDTFRTTLQQSSFWSCNLNILIRETSVHGINVLLHP